MLGGGAAGSEDCSKGFEGGVGVVGFCSGVWVRVGFASESLLTLCEEIGRVVGARQVGGLSEGAGCLFCIFPGEWDVLAGLLGDTWASSGRVSGVSADILVGETKLPPGGASLITRHSPVGVCGGNH